MVSMKMKEGDIVSLNKYLLNIYIISSPVLSAESTVVNETNIISACYVVENRQVNNYRNDIRNKNN